MDEHTQIGPYHLLQQLGEGGMATVYLAEQRDPFHRRVALKVLKGAVDSRDVIARFESEREALNRMTHPGVAKLFDSGVTGDGRPYFVMEYVPGIPITEFCNRRQLTLTERLQLFVQVCEAIHHAHQKGILHCDIKPTNVLVTEQDGRPVTKVIDFGIARATTQPLTPQTLFTEDGWLIGTPSYMSPEQVGAIPREVDARSDVYSLGALFYELLVGVPPLDANRLRQSAVSEMLRLVGEEEPQKPSLRIAELAEGADILARQRRTNARALAKSLRGDIEWIVLRALEKDPELRYGSASELAADVESHLTGEPVTAGPPGIGYRLRKLAVKHRAAAVAATGVFLTLIFGGISSTGLYLRAEHDLERSEIVASMIRAESSNQMDRKAELTQQWIAWNRRELGDSMEFVRWIIEDLWIESNASSADWTALGHDALRIMERAFDRGDTSVIATFMSFPERFLDDQSAQSLRNKVSDLVKQQWAAADADGRIRIADSLEYFAQPYQSAKAGNPDGERLLREILSLRRETGGSDPAALSKAIRDLTDALTVRGSTLQREGKAAETAPLLREALELTREMQSREGDKAARDGFRERVSIESELALALAQLKIFDEAERLLSAAHSSLQEKRGIRSSATQTTLFRLIDFYERLGRTREAARYESLRPAIGVRKTTDLGEMNLPQSFRDRSWFHAGSALVDSRAAWIFQPFEEDARWGVQRSSPQGSEGVRQSNASLAGQPFLRLTDAETKFNTEHLIENCLTDDCGSRLSLTVRSVVSDPMRQRALIFYSKRLNDSWSSTRPTPAGTSLAVWRDPEASAERPQLRAEGLDSAMLFGADEPEWGSAAFSMDNLLYTFACTDDPKTNAPECLLARVPLDRALDRSAWEFYATGGSWATDWRKSKPTLRLQRGEMISVHWNAYLQKYLALCTSRAGIRIRVADHPQGPWSQPIIDLDFFHESRFDLPSSAVGHPEQSRDGGRSVYITFQFGSTLRAAEIEFDQRR